MTDDPDDHAAPDRTPADDGDSDHRDGFPVVGVGASAGGLDALEQLLDGMPPDTGMAFVIVTHTQPGRPSLLPQLLGRHSAMPIVEVEQPTLLMRNTIFMAPIGRYVAIRDGALLPVDMPDKPPRPMPVDYFFRTLADDRRQLAIGVVLSGTGSDGTIGIKEIKSAGGVALAQEESSARYPSMPRSAAATDLVDYVLPPHEMGASLVEYARHAFNRRRHRAEHAGEAEELQTIFHLLRRQSGHDFSSYKPSTLRRRIERRMNVHHVPTVAEYTRFLQTNPGEIDALFHELLIGVTSFFRDPDAYEALAAALPAILADRPNGYVVRAWVPGCSTGEEAYSIAILLRETLERMHRHLTVQIFATDLDATAIDTARAGIYPESIASCVSPERLERYFTREDVGYRIRKDLREMIVFAPHNVISDPPFTRLDLLSCRNLLIYVNSDLQQRIVPLFHYALRRGGLLFLGSSESIGGFGNLFDVLDKKWKLWQRREVAEPGYTTDFVPPLSDARRQLRTSAPPARPSDGTLHSVADRVLFHHLVPPSLLVHESGEIVHIHGRTGEFLELPPGLVTSLNVLAMAREGLGLDLAAALREASVTEGEVFRRGLRVKSNGHGVVCDLRVKRIADPEPFRGLLLISFERPRPADEVEPDGPDASGASARVDELERELQHAKEVHQGVVEELEAANEELKSTNEELQSTNEELQSTNEELETSKEEMQSLNEELQTVNAELQDKLDELSRINDDMKNLLNSTDIATVFLDNQLQIKRYTEQAKKVIPLIPADVGRPIRDLVSRLHYDGFETDSLEVLRTLVFKEAEVRSEDGRWYLARIMPYRTTENVIDGLVITFVDVTRVKGLQEQSHALIAALAHSPTMIFGQDNDLRYTWAASPVFGVAATEVIGKRDQDVIGGGGAALIALKQRALAGGRRVRERVVVEIRGTQRTFDAYLEPVPGEGGAAAGLTAVVTELSPV